MPGKTSTPRIEALLSARLFMSPQVVGEHIYFISNLSGRHSLYRMRHGGSVPEPLLPPDIALNDPSHVQGYSFYVYPRLGKVMVMLDNNGDEHYQPVLIPLEGGFPEPAFGDKLEGYQVFALKCFPDRNLVYLLAASQTESIFKAYRGNLDTREIEYMAESQFGGFMDAVSSDHKYAILVDAYSGGEHVLYLWREGQGRELFYGTSPDQRDEQSPPAINTIAASQFTEGDRGLLFTTSLFDDAFGLGYMRLDDPTSVKPVTISGTRHTGTGELSNLEHLHGNRYLVEYNIDGASWMYEGTFDEAARTVTLDSVVCGQGELSGGVKQGHHYDKEGDRFVLAFSTAASPTQIYTVEGKDRRIVSHTQERVLGIAPEWLSQGEDASFTSFDGLRVSARLYLPSEKLGYEGPRPLIYYVHGGPQGQERPNFAWFSMPLIQFFTLNGFAVFVPNVRGSTGYGLDYAKRVERDWGGKDLQDHIHAMTAVLPNDKRIDVKRAGVMGRSYGGFMTLSLASRYPDMWKAAVDMFGPYNLLTMAARVPPTWRPMMAHLVGDPEKDHDMLVDRSPSTHLHNITAPLLVLQGANDPRVIEQESRDVVEELKRLGKHAEIIVFEDEGHDVLKYPNKVRCYNTIVEFFTEHLRP
jgi:pimeloyl-ACP methyl ester carboxylesterase